MSTNGMCRRSVRDRGEALPGQHDGFGVQAREREIEDMRKASRGVAVPVWLQRSKCGEGLFADGLHPGLTRDEVACSQLGRQAKSCD